MFARPQAREHEQPGAREDGVTARTAASRAASKVSASGGDLSERELIEAAQRDCSKFAGLYEANFERVYAYVARRVRDRDEAQDLTADVFHLALKNLGRFEWRGVPFAAWLFRIAANEIADRSKNVARRRTHGDADPAEMADDSSIGVAAEFEEAERHARLFKLVDGLPRDQSRVIAMRFAEDKSIREIASALKRSEGSIKQLQFRGLQNLRLRMGDSNG